MNSKTNIFKSLEAAYKAIDDKFGKDISVLDISEISSMGNYFIITTSSNPNQLRAIADNIQEELFKLGFKLNHSEGYNGSSWVLLDFGDIIVHIFDKENREFYNLDRVWGDARKVHLDI
ncbi:ribosome silencing factor [Anaeropeptidivorans aminofermentans]|uniref:ribosome silencing factor n=1 Tax=Anaeropeptidivorans aminofermentans TaxID=2934315 RepID=UPI00202438B1|nr:ribosome silencing factor [Anaeropeptidivorans aminofermentans]